MIYFPVKIKLSLHMSQATKRNRKSNQFARLRRFLCFRYFSIKINRIDHLITEIDKIDNHKKLTDRFPIGFRY